MNFYRVGQAAKLLGVSSHHIRKLCQAGIVQAEVSEGRQWKVPMTEVERLHSTGVPPAPSVEQPFDLHRNSSSSGTRNQEEIHRDEGQNHESPEVRSERESVDIAEARLQRRRIELEQEQVEDEFRAREAARTAADQRAQVEQAQQREAATRIQWRNEWLSYGQDRVPRDCPPDLRLRANETVEAVLAKCSIQHAREVVRKLVEAAVNAALGPYYRQKGIEDVINAVVRELPAELHWSEEARDGAGKLARVALANLDSSAGVGEMCTTAKKAVQPLIVVLRHRQAVNKILESMKWWRWLGDDKATDEERTAAAVALKKTLDACAPGTTQAELEKVKTRTLEPFERKIEVRVQEEKRQKEADRMTSRALEHVESHLAEMYEFNSWQDRDESEKQFKDKLRPILLARFLDGRLSEPRSARPLIERYIEHHIEVEDQDDE